MSFLAKRIQPGHEVFVVLHKNSFLDEIAGYVSGAGFHRRVLLRARTRYLLFFFIWLSENGPDDSDDGANEEQIPQK